MPVERLQLTKLHNSSAAADSKVKVLMFYAFKGILMQI